MTEAYGQAHPDAQVPTGEVSGWSVGWTVFAACMMVVQGLWWFFAGFVGVFNSEFFVTTPSYVFAFDTTTWGWIHVLMGVVAVAAGALLFTGAVWARTVGVGMAALAMLVAFAWLPWYPLWAVLFIGISVGVIWALTAHPIDVTGM